MDVTAAHELLGTTPAMSASERRAAYHKQRHSLENHLVESTVPLLKERYRIAIARLDEAFAAVVIAGASEELPVLRGLSAPGQGQPLAGPSLGAPGLAPTKQPPSTAAIWRELPYAGPAAGAPGVAPGPMARPDTPVDHPGPNLPIHPPTSSGSIWRDLPDAATDGGNLAAGADAETPVVPVPRAMAAPAPTADAQPPVPPKPTPNTGASFAATPARQAETPAGGNPVVGPAASTATPSRGAQVLTPTHAHVRVQSRTPTHGAPIIPGDGSRPRSSGKIPVVTPFPGRSAPRILPWLLMLLLIGAIVTAIAWRLARQ